MLTEVMRQNGQDSEQVCFREILMHLRNGNVTTCDWETLCTRSMSKIPNRQEFDRVALHLHPTVEAVTEHNVNKLKANGQPIATIKAVHSGVNAASASCDEASGLEPIISLAHGAQVMLTSNLWVETGLVNGAMGTVVAICYLSGGPPELPLAVMVRFDKYSGPTLHDGSVPIIPIRRTWIHHGTTCSRLQLPLKLAWAITIHKSQGLTLNKVVIDIGKKEYCAGLTFVACSRVRRLTDLAFDPAFDYQRLSRLASSTRANERMLEDVRLSLSDTPSLPGTPSLPDALSLPGTPYLPDTPSLPGTPYLPDALSLPGTPYLPDTPSLPGTPYLPDALSLPGTPYLPDTPSLPGTPSLPDTPSLPGTPSLPDTPSLPGTPSLPDTPSLPHYLDTPSPTL